MAALLEGLHYKAISEQENLAELALNLRYTLNAKKVQVSKLSKNNLRYKVKQAFSAELDRSVPGGDSELLKRIERVNAHFREKRG